MEVKTTKTNSLKNQIKNKPTKTKTARTIVPVDMEMEVRLWFSDIKIYNLIQYNKFTHSER